jgi:DNA relaxase TraI-like protein
MLGDYEPQNSGLRVSDPGELIGHHKVEIADILQASGLEVGQAQALLQQPIEAFLRYVATLPATRNEFYAAPAGLLRLGLDGALLTGRKAQVWEFSGLGHIERRRIETPRWRVACILAALLYDVHRAVTKYVVSGADELWMPLREPLTLFAARQPERRVHLAWREARHPFNNGDDLAWNLPLAHRIVDDGILDFLYHGDPVIIAQFYAVLSGEALHRPTNLIRPLVEAARARLIQRERRPDTTSASEDAAKPPAREVTGVCESAAAPPPAKVSVAAAGTIATSSGGAAPALDYSTQLLVKEIQKVLARPKGAKGQVQLASDGRLRVRCEWIKSLGFEVAQIASRLERSGWLSSSDTAADSQDDRGEVLILTKRVSQVLLRPTTSEDLLSQSSAVTGGATA